MKVLKFGGTSVANSDGLSSVIEIIKKNEDRQVVVVVSALGGITDSLSEALSSVVKGVSNRKDIVKDIENKHLELIKHFIPIQRQSAVISFLKSNVNELENILEAVSMLRENTLKTTSKILSYGELLSSRIICVILEAMDIDVILKDARELIQTDEFNRREIVNVEATAKNVTDFFSSCKNKVVLIPGFIASDAQGETTTLGRGGSDHTASILANALNADSLEIWTDVNGMYTANPKFVSQAIPIPKLSYREAMELSYFGAKVIYPPTLQPLMEKQIPVVIKNTFDIEAEGTLIDGSHPPKNSRAVTGISHIDNVALITLEGSGIIGIPGFYRRLFGALSERSINVIMIPQASLEYSICLAVKTVDSDIAKEAINSQFAFEISLQKVAPAKVEKNMANIAVISNRMKNHQGINGQLFSSLETNNINVRAIVQGPHERNISLIIDEQNVQKALNTLHERFFGEQIKELNLFVTGVGNVGSKLLDQIKLQENYLLKYLRLKVKVIALSNSKKMVLSDKAIGLSDWKNLINENGVEADRGIFFNHVKTLNLKNSIFVDNTANEEVAAEYSRFLKHNIGVITCNKIACASKLSNYNNLKKIARQFGSTFLFETTVGAGLPIIETLNNLIASGDEVTKIQAVLSGSLNFIFNNFKPGTEFHDVVLKAQEEGYTEPNPKIDLSGVDVARKILILARESGIQIELEEVKNESFLPEDCLNTNSNEAFYASLKRHKEHFDTLLRATDEDNTRLKYVAQLDNGSASVGLQHIEPTHDFYDLKGSDNIILFYTHRYSEQPLVIKGAGAGAEVTAAGIFGDIIRIGKL